MAVRACPMSVMPATDADIRHVLAVPAAGGGHGPREWCVNVCWMCLFGVGACILLTILAPWPKRRWEPEGGVPPPVACVATRAFLKLEPNLQPVFVPLPSGLDAAVDAAEKNRASRSPPAMALPTLLRKRKRESGPCEHGRQRSKCKACGGSGICEHGRQRGGCKECGGSSICEHGRRRSRCQECNA